MLIRHHEALCRRLFTVLMALMESKIGRCR
jgi:hypothetical protein